MRADESDERVTVEWFSEVTTWAGAARELRQAELLRGDEDDRGEVPFRGESRLKIEPAQPAKVDVEHDAPWFGGHSSAQKLLCRAERNRSNPVSPEQSGERLSNRGVVVDDSNPTLAFNRRPRRRFDNR